MIKIDAIKEMNSTTVYDKLNRKNVVKVGETWMHGNYGVVVVEKIYRLYNKKCTTTIIYKRKNGEMKAARAESSLGWSIRDNFLFKI